MAIESPRETPIRASCDAEPGSTDGHYCVGKKRAAINADFY
jgi:hypothetical protein